MHHPIIHIVHWHKIRAWNLGFVLRFKDGEPFELSTDLPRFRHRITDSMDCENFVERHGRMHDNVRELEDVKAVSLRRESRWLVVAYVKLTWMGGTMWEYRLKKDIDGGWRGNNFNAQPEHIICGKVSKDAGGTLFGRGMLRMQAFQHLVGVCMHAVALKMWCKLHGSSHPIEVWHFVMTSGETDSRDLSTLKRVFVSFQGAVRSRLVFFPVTPLCSAFPDSKTPRAPLKTTCSFQVVNWNSTGSGCCSNCFQMVFY